MQGRTRGTLPVITENQRIRGFGKLGQARDGNSACQGHTLMSPTAFARCDGGGGIDMQIGV